MPKLVAIGDSLTQGVMSGAILKTEFSYPALIAEAMGLTARKPGDGLEDTKDEFWVPNFPGSGLPLNIEYLLREIGPDFDTDNLEELISKIQSGFQFISSTKESYTSDPADCGRGYHNLAVAGFKVADSFNVSVESCPEQLGNTTNKTYNYLNFAIPFLKNLSNGHSPSDIAWSLFSTALEELFDVFAPPSRMKYRIAQHVLAPSGCLNSEETTQIGHLKHIAKKAEENNDKIENLILFLGANDCLGTVRDFNINDNTLTPVDAFECHYRRMVQEISSAISPDTKVFVANIPHVTIPPITRGIGNRLLCDLRYFQHYAPFFMPDDRHVFSNNQRLTGEQAKQIDNHIDTFNKKICEIVNNREYAERGDWHIVNICRLLDNLAFRRSEYRDQREPLRLLLQDVTDHPLLSIDPTPSVLRFASDNSTRINGGLFSLDCFHPTTIGYGLIAEKFLTKMHEVGVCISAAVHNTDWYRLNWHRLIERDTLVQNPPALWDNLVEAARSHPRIAQLIYSVLA